MYRRRILCLPDRRGSIDLCKYPEAEAFMYSVLPLQHEPIRKAFSLDRQTNLSVLANKRGIAIPFPDTARHGKCA